MLRSRVLRSCTAVAFLLSLLAFSQAPLQAQNGSASPPSASAPAKLHFFLRLTPPRPTFTTDMTPQERDQMGQHLAYWSKLAMQGKVLVFGPVMDPKGAFGMAVLEVSSQAEAQAMVDGDPTVKSGLNKIELLPMIIGPRAGSSGT